MAGAGLVSILNVPGRLRLYLDNLAYPFFLSMIFLFVAFLSFFLLFLTSIIVVVILVEFIRPLAIS